MGRARPANRGIVPPPVIMPSDSKNLVPLSILGAGALVGAGLFFGLRERPVLHPDAPSASGSHTATPILVPPASPTLKVPVVAPPEPAPGGPGPVSPGVVTKATEDATKALEKAKTQLTESCWKPALAASPEPKSARYLFNLSFDAQGHELARGVTELRDASRADVGQCLRAQPLGLEIPAPGAIIAVSIAVEFP